MKRRYKSDSILEKFKTGLTASLGDRVQELLLFGSRARGEATADSDYDLLIVVDRIDKMLLDAIDRLAGEVLVEHSKLISAFPITADERNKRFFSPLMINIAREGVVL